MGETYYIKKGNKYVPAGISGPDLYEGIWLVEIKPGSKSYKNLVMRLCDLPDPKDLQLLAKVTMLEDLISKTLMTAWSGGKQASIAEVASRIATAIATAESKLTIKDFRGS